jgi:undecaprenyl diphosphate synthase
MKPPNHVAIIMDGNGRWAKRRLLPRVAGHQQGLESVRATITACLKKNISYLTLFTFSSENWRRSKTEIDFLFGIFLRSLRSEMHKLNEHGIKLKIVGNLQGFSADLMMAIQEAEALTKENTKLQLNIAFNYGGRWDILEAVRSVGKKIAAGELLVDEITETLFQGSLSLNDCPDPDLLIRTSGEYRISNFLLWQFAYTELYFTETYWPDFREAQFEEALLAYSKRQRRFGSSEAASIVEQSSFSFENPEQVIHA